MTREGGLIAVISVKLPDPQFEGQTKSKLSNTDISPAVTTAAGEAIRRWLEQQPTEAKAIMQHCMTNKNAREAARRARENVMRKNALNGTTLPGKACRLHRTRSNQIGALHRRGRIRRRISQDGPRSTLPSDTPPQGQDTQR